MSEVSESALPFPHRANNLYKILYLLNWNESGEAASERHINWMGRTYAYLAPFVSKSPRAAYVNYRDLDLGINNDGNTSYARASVWGFRYFKNNFKRLVRVKTKVDPGNFFRNERSIPPLYSWSRKN
ncbi:cannabidiolic acid synthase [Phtheirospermum japonicum]|uniref:Cannabidiolic acid synthase n=1 Tax=Phtheirospermum japonicum TaxID=374723 RepID=A0A830CSW2_9LAMI|nr:cannabidiolic acid synthase [Phtheirospermum japonicum]